VPALSDYYIISSREKVENRKSTVRSFYLDAVLLAQYWDIVQPYKYHHTGFPTNCYGLREGLAEIAEEGLEAVWKRHRENSELLWKGLEDMGIELFVSDKVCSFMSSNHSLKPSTRFLRWSYF
jgi:alanine-glyoxylate transaminase/serine-glyoxylate transaminase/serine-pyruvate transaminase